MLYFPHTKVVDSGEAVVAPGAEVLAEGQVMVRQPGATAQGVTQSTGAEGEIFAGFAIAGVSAAPFLESHANKVETFVVPAGGKVTLQFAPVAGQFSVFDQTAGAAAAGTLAGKVISGLTVGNTVSVTYKYELTVVQARALMGDAQPGGYAGMVVGQIGLAKRGTIYTSEFDASVDWSTVTAIKMAAGGMLTGQAGDGEAINAVVVALPSQDVPFLGLEFSTL